MPLDNSMTLEVKSLKNIIISKIEPDKNEREYYSVYFLNDNNVLISSYQDIAGAQIIKKEPRGENILYRRETISFED